MNEISKALLAMSIAPLPLVASLTPWTGEPIGYGTWFFAGAITLGAGEGHGYWNGRGKK